jgi:Holliday junction resolvase RusA-like endonuclease
MIRIYLPIPVSVNAMYGIGRGKKFISKAYAKWISRADEWLSEQGARKPRRPIDNPVELAIVAYRGKGWTERKRDLDNMIKGVQDYLVRAEWLADDNSQIIRRVSVELAAEHMREACVRVSINAYVPGIAD